MTDRARPLIGAGLRVVNIGLDLFAAPLEDQGVDAVHVDWRPPPAGGASSYSGPVGGPETDEANRSALERLVGGEPVLVDVAAASEAIPGLSQGVLLHAGPPIAWEEMCGPMRAAVLGAVQYEGWAGDQAEAEALADRGEMRFHPNHDFGAVGPMAGITSPSMPVFVVENRTFGNRAFCTINEGIGKVLRFGANDPQVIERLRWIGDILAPALRAAVDRAGGLPLGPLMSRALTMGDEMHQRNVGATSLFIREMAPGLARAGATDPRGDVLAFLAGNDQFFLNLSMAASKAMMDPLEEVPGSTVVWAMCRNGRDFGIRVTGTGRRWFTSPALMPRGLYFPGYSAEDANPDLGDSAILETVGLGGFAMAASPSVVGFVGAGTFQDAVNYTREMGEITLGRNAHFALPTLDFQGTPSGIDVRKVVETGIAPVINTGIAHKRPGVGQVGAGIVRAPMECFTQALEALTEEPRRSGRGGNGAAD